jgi:peptidoglycan-N-acetylglucosamine deacetylase
MVPKGAQIDCIIRAFARLASFGAPPGLCRYNAPAMAPQHRTCAVSVDLDGLDCYYGIHGLGPVPEGLSGLVLRRALPRFLDLFDRRGIQATLFVIGRDAMSDGAAVREAVAAGHEIANHSYTHPYGLLRLPPAEMEAEVVRAHDVLTEVVSAPPVGFRSPGYTVDAGLLAVLCRLGYRYDSSMFPCWPYYAAKAAVLMWMRLSGRRSASVLHDPRALLAPPDAYRPDGRRPWRRGTAPIVELPVAVTPGLRLPAIGTVLLAGASPLRRHVLRAMRRRPFFNLELHGIELCDAQQDGIPDALVRRQPDLCVSLPEKLELLDAALDAAGAGRRFVTLREAAAELA